MKIREMKKYIENRINAAPENNMSEVNKRVEPTRQRKEAAMMARRNRLITRHIAAERRAAHPSVERMNYLISHLFKSVI